MFNHKISHRKALHSLLHKNPIGLSLIDIADELNISESICGKLIAVEENEKRIQCNCKAGKYLYISKITIKSTYYQDKSSKDTHGSYQKHKIFNLKPVLFIMSLMIISVGLFEIYNLILNLRERQTIGYSLPEQTKKEIESKSNLRKKIKLQTELNDLNNRVTWLQTSVIENKCTEYWNIEDSCYLNGRLINKEEFDNEITEIKQMINRVQEELNISSF